MVPKTQRSTLLAMFHTIFGQSDAVSVWAQARDVVELCQHKHVADYLEKSLDDLLAFTTAPKSVWTKIWSNNPTERINREIRRRADVSVSSQTEMLWSNLVGAVLTEHHDDRIHQKHYISLTSLAKTKNITDEDPNNSAEIAV